MSVHKPESDRLSSGRPWSALHRRSLRKTGPRLYALMLALFVMLPVLGVIANLTQGGTLEVLQHLISTVLPGYVGTTLVLGALVAIGTILLGVGSAWLVALCDFPGRRLLSWALLLPMAMPAYVVAYAYTDFLQYSGTLQTALRAITGWSAGRSGSSYWFPEIRSLPGAAFVFSITLYPYVYLLARTAFLQRSPALLDASRMLGTSPLAVFFRVTLPMARPAVVAGVTLALMETLADYGTVAYFGVTSFSTGIYRAWFSLGDRAAASQLAVALMLFVALLVWIEQRQRGQARYIATGRPAEPPHRMTGWRVAAAWLAGLIPILLGFILPVGILMDLLTSSEETIFNARYLLFLRNSLTLSGVTALIAVLIATSLAYAARVAHNHRPGRIQALCNRMVGMGYAVPGIVIAVGVLIPLSAVDRSLSAWLAQTFDRPEGLILTGTMAILVYACLVRFSGVALQTIEAGLSAITPNMDAAARSLGSGFSETFRRIHLPLLSRSMLAAMLLVFVDTMKELPATLVLRPFNFDTLAVMTYQYAADERLAEAALPALTLVVAGLLPVIFISRMIGREANRV